MQDVEVADGPEPGGDRAEPPAEPLRPLRSEAVAEDAPGGPLRRVATRIAWSSSGSLPSRVPGSRSIIRARWKRRTFRPASARWSSAVTPGVLPTGIRSTTRDRVGAPQHERRGGFAPPPSARARRPAPRYRRSVALDGAVLGHHRAAGPGLAPERVGGLDRPDGLVGRRRPRPARSDRGRPHRDVLGRLTGRPAGRPYHARRRGLAPALSPAPEPGQGRPSRSVRSGARSASRPRISSTSSSTKRSTTRPRETTSDLVEAQLDGRLATGRREVPLAAELADRDQLDERPVAAQLQDQRASVRRRPGQRLGGPVGRPLELLAALYATLPSSAVRLDRDDRAGRRWRSRAANPARASAPPAESR